MAQELDAVHARHAEVAENKIDRRAVDLVQRAHPVMGVERGGHTELLEVALEQTDDELVVVDDEDVHRSEEHTSELQSLMRISYAVFCLKKKHPYTTLT